MRLTAAVSSGLALLTAGLANARIEGFAAPSSVAPGSWVRLEIEGYNYIQSVEDVAMVFGWQNASSAFPQSIGNLLDSKLLGRDLSNVLGNITHYVQIPCAPTVQRGEKLTLFGSLFSLYGAALSPTIQNFAVNVTVRQNTGGDYVGSTPVPSS